MLQEVARIMLVRITLMDSGDESYEERIVAICVSTRRALLKHPNAAPLILRYFPKHMLLAAYDRAARDEPFPTSIQLVVIEAIERLEILRAYRLGEIDVIVGVNLLREGLDLPETSFIGILDAE